MKGGKKVAILAIYQYMYKVTKCILNRKSMKFAGESLKNLGKRWRFMWHQYAFVVLLFEETLTAGI